MQKVNLAAAFATFDDAWRPRIAGEINDACVKLVKLRGAFDSHHHDLEDELFLVTAGRMRLGLRSRISNASRRRATPPMGGRARANAEPKRGSRGAVYFANPRTKAA